MKKTSTRQSFHIQGVQKELKVDSIRFIFHDEELFTSLKRIRKILETLILSSKSVTKVSKQTLENFFRFMEVRKSQKQTLHRLYCSRVYSCKTKKRSLISQKMTLMHYRNGFYNNNDFLNINITLKNPKIYIYKSFEQ